MNDFTKEELTEILSWGQSFWLTVLSVGAEKTETQCIPLKEKIKSMIDNYCDHESCVIDYDYQPLRCNKCKSIVE